MEDILHRYVNVILLQDDGHSPLHIAAWEGDEAMVKYLNTMKANAYITDKVNDRQQILVRFIFIFRLRKNE